MAISSLSASISLRICDIGEVGAGVSVTTGVLVTRNSFLCPFFTRQGNASASGVGVVATGVGVWVAVVMAAFEAYESLDTVAVVLIVTLVETVDLAAGMTTAGVFWMTGLSVLGTYWKIFQNQGLFSS